MLVVDTDNKSLLISRWTIRTKRVMDDMIKPAKLPASSLRSSVPQADLTGNSTLAAAPAAAAAVSLEGIVETTGHASAEHLKRSSSSYSGGNEGAEYNSTQARKKQETEQRLKSLTDSQAIIPDTAMTKGQDKDIAYQKKRALELWKVVQGVVGVDDKVADVVTERLDKGLVPPVFHAYCALYQKIRMADSEELSGLALEAIELRPEITDVAKASAGEQPEGTIFGKGPIDVSDENQPSAEIAKITAGEAGDDTFLEEGVFIKVESFFDSNNKARLKVRDRALRDIWIFSEEWTAKVCALLNADAEMVGADVEVTRVDSNFYMGKVKGTSSTHLITRRLSRGVVAECLKMPSEDTVAIVGNPGIGKSWTLIYALQQLLLREGACILFFSAKRERALACIRQNNKVYAWKAEVAKASSSLFDYENVWVLLDPIEASKGSTGIVNGERRLLYAASNNIGHFANDVTKLNAQALHFLSPFDDDEIRAAVPFMTGKKFDEIVFDWASKVGNLPRWLLKKEQFEGRLKDGDLAIGKLSPELVKKILESNGLSDGQVKINLPGTVFALSAYREWDKDSGEPVNIGYDGEEGVIYTMPSLKLMNDYVFSTVAGGNRERILSYWSAISSTERSKMGEAVENLIWQDLQQGCLFRTWSMTGQRFEASPDLTNISVMRAGCTMADLTNVFDSGNKLVRMAPGTVLIDFAGPGRRVYQATVSADHSMSLVGLQKLLEAAGYMKFTGGNFMMIVGDLPKLDFYWVVPHEKFGVWKEKCKPKTVRDEQVSRALAAHVSQFVLSLDVKPPNAADMAVLLGTQPDWMGKNVVLAGNIPVDSKTVISAILKLKGAEQNKNVNGNTTYLITGTNPAKVKLDAATKSHIPIVSHIQFVQKYQHDAAAANDNNLE
jgi:BRCA1 C Terminus (BRCT) domain